MPAWTEDEVKLLVSLYPETTTAELTRKLGRSRPSIMWKAVQLGLTKSREHRSRQASLSAAKAGVITGWKNGQKLRKHFFDEHYFDSIDTPEKAYWLGFIQADGSLVRNVSAGRIVCLAISLQERDRSHLEQFVHDIGGDLKSIEVLKSRHRWSDKDQVGIRLRSVPMINALLEAGIESRKSESGAYAPIPLDILASHYVRGVFDGNGWVYVNVRSGHTSMAICAPGKAFAEDLLRTMRVGADVEGGGVYDNHGHYDVRFQTTNHCNRVAEWMYQGATRHLERKKQVFDSQKRQAS